MKYTFLLIFLFSVKYLFAQCPPGNTSKNGQCIKVEYGSATEANQTLTNNITLVISNSSTGANGNYTPTAVCNSGGVSFVVYTQNGSSSCNCSGAYGQTEDGTFSFSNGLMCDYTTTGTLPVKFGEISIFEFPSAVIQWESLSEENNDYYIISGSHDSKEFFDFARVEGLGTTNTKSMYTFPLETKHKYYSYYRIKQIDFNGEIGYSPVYFYKWLNSESKVWTSGNMIYITSAEENGTLEIYDSFGRKIISKLFNGDSVIDSGDLPIGIYFIRIGNELATHKVLIN